MKANRTCLTWSLAAAMLTGIGTSSRLSAKTEAIMTTDAGCVAINLNQYADKLDVYVRVKGFDPGNYAVAVSSPEGTLLGSGTVNVTLDPQCVHLWDLVTKASDNTQGFDDTDNLAGLYKVNIGGKNDNFKIDSGQTALAIICPEDVSVDCEGGNGAHVTFSDPGPTGGATPYKSVVCTADLGNGTVQVQSGDLFPNGTTTVTCTVVDANDQSASCTFDVTVKGDCRNTCVPSCPLDITQCNDKGQCYATVSFQLPAPIGNCNVVCDYQSGDQFAVGTTVVTCTTTDDTGYVNRCSFKVTVNDCEPPTITCPAPITGCLKTINGSAVNVGTAVAQDNCSATVNGVRSDTKALNALYPLGVTTITWTATDGVNQASCTQKVTIVASTIRAKKFYDVNVNAVNDDLQVLPGWKFKVTGTDTDGNAVGPLYGLATANGTKDFLNLPLGSYTVTELDSTIGNWVASLPKSVTVQLTQCSTVLGVLFGNYCPVVPTPSAHPKSFWTGSGGQALLTAADFTDLNSLKLVNPDGTDRDFNSTLAANKLALLNWLNQSWGGSFANELAAELAVNKLNVNHGFTDPNIVVDGSRTVAQEIAYASSLIAANPVTTLQTSTAYREQKRVFQLLQRLSSGQPFALPQPCPFQMP